MDNDTGSSINVASFYMKIKFTTYQKYAIKQKTRENVFGDYMILFLLQR